MTRWSSALPFAGTKEVTMAHENDGTDRRTPATPAAAVLTPPTGLESVPALPRPRTPSEPRTPAGPPAPVVPQVGLCTCGHPEDLHDHYRPGTDCGSCGPRVCAGYRPADEPASTNPLRRWLRRR
ncbi:hypothetical protein [Pseudonocardia alni]|uniref:Uncharacterized protein n=1 Tax=Pseudonocardia alni subsp. carboxydivorans TaxID=415010 RepID=A0ABU9AMR6_PSEA5